MAHSYLESVKELIYYLQLTEHVLANIEYYMDKLKGYNLDEELPYEAIHDFETLTGYVKKYIKVEKKVNKLTGNLKSEDKKAKDEIYVLMNKLNKKLSRGEVSSRPTEIDRDNPVQVHLHPDQYSSLNVPIASPVPVSSNVHMADAVPVYPYEESVKYVNPYQLDTHAVASAPPHLKKFKKMKKGKSSRRKSSRRKSSRRKSSRRKK